MVPAHRVRVMRLSARGVPPSCNRLSHPVPPASPVLSPHAPPFPEASATSRGRGGPGVARDGGERRMGAVTPGETLGTLCYIHVGSNKTK